MFLFCHQSRLRDGQQECVLFVESLLPAISFIFHFPGACEFFAGFVPLLPLVVDQLLHQRPVAQLLRSKLLAIANINSTQKKVGSFGFGTLSN